MRPYQRKLNQFRKLSREINLLVGSGQFFRLTIKKKRALIRRLRDLYYKLSQVFSEFRLKKILAGAAILLGLTTAPHIQAQTFGPPLNQPYSIQIDPYTFSVSFADMDDDGDLDLLMVTYGGTFHYQENEGTPESRSFKAPVTDPFGLSSIGIYQLISSSIADLDDDGDFDMIVMEAYYGDMLYYENNGTAQAPNFAPPDTNPHGFAGNYYYIFPAFADMDGDGDLDLWMGGYGYNSQIAYFENTGTPQQPAWAAIQYNPFNLAYPPDALYPAPALADLDLDGDLDLLMTAFYYGSYTNYGAQIYYYENAGTVQSPAFSSVPKIDTFNLSVPSPQANFLVFPKFADMDNDGDMDLFGHTIGYASNNLYYFENQTTLPGISKHPREIGFRVYPNPSAGQFTLELSNPIPNGQEARMYNTVGQTVWQKTVRETQTVVSVAHLPAGAYLLRVENEEASIVLH